MSALADEPDHFQRWSGDVPEAFARRLDYGRYVEEVLADAIAASSASLRHVAGVAERFAPDGDLVRVTLVDGEPIVADALVLATGLETPFQLPYLRALGDDERLIVDPWVAGALDAIADGETIATIGSSLTAIDVAGSILNRHPRATVIALSRHGNLPRSHEDPWRPRLPEPAFTVDELVVLRRPAGRGGRTPAGVRRGLAPRGGLVAADLPGAVDGGGRRRAPRVRRRLPQCVGDPPPSDRRRDRTRRGPVDRDGPDGRPRGGDPRAVDPDGGRLRIDADGGGQAGASSWAVDRIVVAIGPDDGRDGEPAARCGDRERVAAPRPAWDRDRRRPGDRPRDRRPWRDRDYRSMRSEPCARGCCGRRSPSRRSACRPRTRPAADTWTPPDSASSAVRSSTSGDPRFR